MGKTITKKDMVEIVLFMSAGFIVLGLLVFAAIKFPYIDVGRAEEEPAERVPDYCKKPNDLDVVRSCIDGHWYIEKMNCYKGRRGYYGIAPIFDDDGKPVRCPKESK